MGVFQMKTWWLFLISILFFTLGQCPQGFEEVKAKPISASSYKFDAARSLTLDSSGNVYYVGVFSDVVTLNNLKLVSAGKTDIFVAKLNRTLNYEWVTQITGTQREEAKSIEIGPDGLLYLSGFSESEQTQFGAAGMKLAMPPDTQRLAFLTKIDPATGSFLQVLNISSSHYYHGWKGAVIESFVFSSKNTLVLATMLDMSITIDTTNIRYEYSTLLTELTVANLTVVQESLYKQPTNESLLIPRKLIVSKLIPDHYLLFMDATALGSAADGNGDIIIDADTIISDIDAADKTLLDSRSTIALVSPQLQVVQVLLDEEKQGIYDAFEDANGIFICGSNHGAGPIYLGYFKHFKLVNNTGLELDQDWYITDSGSRHTKIMQSGEHIVLMTHAPNRFQMARYSFLQPVPAFTKVFNGQMVINAAVRYGITWFITGYFSGSAVGLTAKGDKDALLYRFFFASEPSLKQISPEGAEVYSLGFTASSEGGLEYGYSGSFHNSSGIYIYANGKQTTSTNIIEYIQPVEHHDKLSKMIGGARGFTMVPPGMVVIGNQYGSDPKHRVLKIHIGTFPIIADVWRESQVAHLGLRNCAADNGKGTAYYTDASFDLRELYVVMVEYNGGNVLNTFKVTAPSLRYDEELQAYEIGTSIESIYYSPTDMFISGILYGSDIVIGDMVLAGNYSNQAFVSSYSTGGPTHWTTVANSTIYSIAKQVRGVPGSSKVYVAGEFEGTITFGDFNATSLGETDIFVAQLNQADGKIQWLRTFGGPYKDTLQTLRVAGLYNGEFNVDEVYIGGAFTLFAKFGDSTVYTTEADSEGYILKLDQQGKIVYLDTIISTGNTEVFGLSIIEQTIHVFGNFRGTMKVVGTNSITTSNAAVFKWIKADTAQCQPCGAGEYAIVGGGLQECMKCPPGTVSKPESSVCTPCPAGTYLGKVNECVMCPPGTYNPNVGGSSPSSCLKCSPGTFSALSGQSSCSSCGVGNYSEVAGASVCTPCTPGTYSQKEGTILCVSCPAGYYSTSPGSAGCTQCEVGFYASSTGSSICLPCQEGTFTNQNASTSCEKCPKGSYTSKKESTGCTPCAIGQYASEAGSAACLKCPQGQFQTQNGSESCLHCPMGQYTSTDGTLCMPCALGEYLDNTFTCKKCPKGYFQNATTGATACSICLPGQYSTIEGSGSCSQCNPGEYQPKGGESGCLSCPLGFVSDVRGSGSCNACLPGTYSSPNRTYCLACAPGYYQDEGEKESCKQCEFGEHQPESGKTFCVDCPAGTYADATASCKNCSMGTYNAHPKRLSICEACPAGHIAGASGLSNCTSCDYNQFTADSIYCQPCEKGKITSMRGATECTPCIPGTHYDEATKRCIACEPGYFSKEAGSMKCSPCLEGFYSNERVETGIGAYGEKQFRGAVVCTPCGINTYTDIQASSSCKPCDKNSTCGLGTITPLLSADFQGKQAAMSVDPYFDGSSSAVAQNNSPAGTSLKISLASIIGFALLMTMSILFTILIISLSTGKCLAVRSCLTFVDIFGLNHFVPYEKSPVNQKKVIGGLFTILYIFLIIFLFTFLLIDVIFGNRADVTSISPEQVVEKSIREFKIHGPVGVEFSLYNFPSASCNLTSMLITGVNVVEDGVATTVAKYNSTIGACNVKYSCSNCELTGQTQVLEFIWTGPLVMSNMFRYTLYVPHFIKGENFVVSEVVTAPRGNAIAGTKPTEISLALTKSFFTERQWDSFIYEIFSRKDTPDKTTAGYIISRFPTSLGSTVSSAEVGNANMLYLKMNLNVDNTVFQIKQSEKYYLVTWISFLLPLLGTVGTIVVKVMTALESAIIKVLSMRKKKLAKDSEAPSETTTSPQAAELKEM